MNKAIIILLAVLPLAALSQPHYSQVLKDIEANSPMLRAAATQAEARQASARSGLLLADPEVEAAYYWGDPATIGIRWDLSVSQSFEMPSVMVRRARLRSLQADAAQLGYQTARQALLLETQQLCADLIYHRGVAEVYSRRCTAAIRLAQLYQRRFNAGDCSILDYNRAQMELADVQNKAAEACLLEDHDLHDLRTLMNDDAYSFYQQEYESVAVEPTFEGWYEQLEMRNPSLKVLDNQLSVSQQEAALSRAQWLPEVQVGYASENVVGETFRGITLGLSLPLWSQQRAVRAARLQTEAAQQTFEAQRAEAFSHYRCMFHRHEALIRNLQNLRTAFSQNNSLELLDKALEAGEISLEQYLQQADFYYNMELQIWEVAHELEQLHLNLYAIEL